MINMINFLIMLLIISQHRAIRLIPNNLDLNISSIAPCQKNGGYPIQVDNVVVNLDRGKIIVSGTLTTSVDLIPPIKAVLKVEKDEIGAWIEIPCVDSVGSCTYDDLCIYSVPTNNTCPESFIANNVPCRCPIPKGNYTIPSSTEFEIQHNYFSIYSGSYWAKVVLVHGNMNLTCYEVYFQIEDKSIYKRKKETDQVFNSHVDSQPFVTLM